MGDMPAVIAAIHGGTATARPRDQIYSATLRLAGHIGMPDPVVA